MQYPPVQQQGNTSQYNVQTGNAGREWVVSILLSYFLGALGVDRFYLGYTGLGILKLLTCGGCGLWALIDFLLIGFNAIRDASGLPLTGREGKEWVFYLLIGLSVLSFFIGFFLSFLGLA